ncbi:uncharacterized protein LOC124925253 [Impatiens glandulifera]|uniref:uncharacterized protein LOC124925253 n=1 Tax=Impatiens glandulifera TaxID=253017 RepID=UPI001FB0E2F1|nr:uncharacterized protein LOC124925253 [Impatiens glandulifera]
MALLKTQSVSRYILYFIFIGNYCVSGGGAVEFPAPTVHEILHLYGFPRGLMPRSAKGYTLSADGTFEVELEGICYVQFKEQHLVYFDKVIRGKLKHGSVFIMSGIQTKKFFFWVPITGIYVQEITGMLDFHVGPLSEKIPAKQFDKIRNCLKKGERKWNEIGGGGVESI